MLQPQAERRHILDRILVVEQVVGYIYLSDCSRRDSRMRNTLTGVAQ